MKHMASKSPVILRDKILFAIGSLTALLWVNGVRAATVASSSHPNAIYHGFNSGSVPFETFAVKDGVPSGARFALDSGTLKLTNAFAGSFSVNTKIEPFSADKYSHLFFDYKLQPDVKVNLFFLVNDVFHGVTFSGPNTVRPGSHLLGKIEGVKADGQWHRAHVPLRDWLRRYDPLADELNVTMVVIGNWDNSGWLMAGMGGNGPGATWWMDNFALVGTGAGEVKAELKGDDGKPVPNAAGAQWMLDNKKAGQGASVTATAGDGFHLLEAHDANGKLLAAYPLYAAPGAPKIGAPRIDGDLIRIPINVPAGLKTKDVKLKVGEREFTAASKWMQWNGDELVFDAGAAGMRWKDGGSLGVQVSGVNDVQGRAAPEWKGNLTVDYAAHKTAPGVPKVQIEGVPTPRPLPELRNVDLPQPTVPAPIFGAGDGTFEESMDEWLSVDPTEDAILERDSSTAATGKYSLRLTSPKNAARFWATIRTSGFDAAKVPVISFDYKIPPQLRADFMLRFDGKDYSIQFTDKDNPAPRLGAVPDVIADNQWHHAEINLGALLREAVPGRNEYRVDAFYIGDGGWLGNARGVQYWFDNFQFVPLVKGTPLQVNVAVSDVTGLKGVSWLLDDKPHTPVPTQVKAEGKIELTGAGRKWLHVRAQNGAGQWSETLDVPLWLSEGPPKVALDAVTPPPGARTVPASLEIPLRAEGGIKGDSIKLAVAGRDYTLKDAALTYDKKANKIVWDAAPALAAGALKAPENGARIEWKLAPVMDFLGEEAAPAEGHWINDFAGDKIGPRVQVSSETHALYFHDDGEGELKWKADEGAKVEKVAREGGSALKFTNTLEGGAFAVQADFPEALAWDVRRYGLISFDYRLPVGANVMIRLRFSNGRSWPMNFAGEKIERALGSVPDIIADGKWHTATFNMADFMERDQRERNSRNLTITGFEFRDMTQKTPANIAWELDNFLIQQSGGPTVKLAWSAHDLSGTKGYRVAWDQTPTTTPTEATAEASRSVEAKPGLYFLHVQAEDGAGNWGPVLHRPVIAAEKSSTTVSNPFLSGAIPR